MMTVKQFSIQRFMVFLTMTLRLTHFLAAEESEGLRALIQSSPEIPVAGSPWVLTLLVNHAVPEEVTVMAPPFTGTFFLDQVLKGPRMVNPATGQNFTEKNAPQRTAAETGGLEGGASPEQNRFEHWTAMEYRFMLNSPGTAALESFTISAPSGKIQTAPLSIRIRNARSGTGQIRPKLTWEGFPSGIKTGEAAVFSLRVSGGDPVQPLPDADFFMPPVQPGIILETASVSPEEQADGLALKLLLIPLNAESFTLPRRTLSRGNAVFEIPPLHIPIDTAISPAQGTALQDGVPANASDNEAGAGEIPAETSGRTAPPFPAFDSAPDSYPDLYKKSGGDYEAVYTAAKRLWETGCRAEALAELRRQERDHPAGPLFMVLRKAAEQSLGLLNTASEERRKFPLLITALSAGLALAAFICRIKSAQSPAGKKRVTLGVITPLTCGCLAVLIALFGLTRSGTPGIFFADTQTTPVRSASGVMKEAALRRVPGPLGKETARFREGQPVRLSSGRRRRPEQQTDSAGGHSAWLLVTANDGSGLSGWVPKETIIFY
ncbi:MAG: hypothetical protein LBD48_15005 [Treponema sp.]|jgi:hypothetical protein|nr:hypothetical protein [Treponema sp.]